MDIEKIVELNQMKNVAEKLSRSLILLETEIGKLPDTEEFQPLYKAQAEMKLNFENYFCEITKLLGQIMNICHKGMESEE